MWRDGRPGIQLTVRNCRAQSPSWVCASSASGLTTAMRFASSAANGRDPLFKQRHGIRESISEVELLMLVGADDRVDMFRSGRRDPRTGLRRNLSARMRETAASISDSSSKPVRTAGAHLHRTAGGQTRSLPALDASAAACNPA